MKFSTAIIGLFICYSLTAQSPCAKIEALTKVIEGEHITGLLPKKELLSRSLSLTLKSIDPYASFFLEMEIMEIRKIKSLCGRYKAISTSHADGLNRYLRILDTLRVDYTQFKNDSALLNPLDRSPLFRESLENLSQKIARDICYLSLLEYASDSTQTSFENGWNKYYHNAIEFERCRIERFNQKNEYLLPIYLNAIGASHDPHTNFFDPETLQEFYNDLSSEILTTGIIVDYDIEGDVRIVDILPGSSADKIPSIAVGDKILKVKFDNEFRSANCIEPEQLVSILSGGDNTQVNLIIQKKSGKIEEKELHKAVTENDYNNIITATTTAQEERKLGYLYFYSFYVDEFTSVSNDLFTKLEELKKEDIDGLVIDLRFNGGGDIGNAISLIGSFIDYGALFIHDNKKDAYYTIRDYNRGTLFEKPLIILVNFASASASEIFASSLRSNGRAIIVGEPTYGKASGQNVIPLHIKNESEPFGFLKVTNSKYHEVHTGFTHQEIGLQPDIPVLTDIPGMLFTETIVPYHIKNDTLLIPRTSPKKINHLSDLKENSIKRLKEDLSYLKSMGRRSRTYELLDGGFYMSLDSEKFRKQYRNNNQLLSIASDSVKYREFKIVSGKKTKDLNDQLALRLEIDHQLHETFNILADWINITNHE